jgi:competence protein ComEC
MAKRNIKSLFRFVLTHPDMDHMDGIEALFKKFSPPNFWDTANTCDKDTDDWSSSPYNEDDWTFYKTLRDGATECKRLVYHSGGARKDFWKDDGLWVLAPTETLIASANETEEWNDSSYVILYKVKPDWKVLFGGDSHDATWEHILEEHEDLVADVDVLIAPHHGRDSDRDFEFLDVLKPKLTLFGNAPSKHLAYDAWSSRDLPVITNNQAGTIIVDLESDKQKGDVYVTNEAFARKANAYTFESNVHDGAWYHGTVRSK